MDERANTTVHDECVARGARKSRARTFFVRFMAIFMTIAMVLSGDGVTYATKALAQTVIVQAGEVANAVSDAADRIVTSPGEKGDTSDPIVEEGVSAEPPHRSIVGTLPVYLAFTLDREDSVPCAVAIKLQQRKSTWNPDACEWSPIDEAGANNGWEDVIDKATLMPVVVRMSAEDVSVGVLASKMDDDPANDGATYTFANLPVQTVTADGAYEARFEYRAIVACVDDASEDVMSTNIVCVSTDEAEHTQTFVVDAASTGAQTTNYVVTVSTEPALVAKGDSPETDEAVIAERTLRIAGETVAQPEPEPQPKPDSQPEPQQRLTFDPEPQPESEPSSGPQPEPQPQPDQSSVKIPQVLIAKIDGYTITVNLAGQAQEGYQLKVTRMEPTKQQLTAVEKSLTTELPDGVTRQAHVAAKDLDLFDITVCDKDGNKIELDKSVRVNVAPSAKSANKGESEVPEVVHLEGEKATHLSTKPIDANEGTSTDANPKDDSNMQGFSFKTEGFSPFAFAYTVDFEYSGYTWSMPGGGTALLSDVLNQLKVEDFTIANVTDAEFSKAELIKIERVSATAHDWQLTSLKPFTSNETLTLTLDNGDTVTIMVTDEMSGTVKLTGIFEYVETYLFKDLLRPKEFNQTFAVVPIYMEGEQEKEADQLSTQDTDRNAQGYIFFYPPTTDNSPDGSVCFDITNLPRTVTVDGVQRNVVKYRVIVPDPQPSYYEQRHLEQATTQGDISTEDTGANVLKTIELVALYPKTCKTFTLRSNVVPSEATTSFKWVITFTRPNTAEFNVDAEVDSVTIDEFETFSDGVFSLAEGNCIIPCGLEYEARQIAKDGYRLGDESTQVAWTGTIPDQDGELEISSVNYALNMSLPFTVDWKDNNNVNNTRPSDQLSIFILQVKKANDDNDQWADFPMDSDDEELEAAYGITSAPTLEVEGNNYTYKGLPGADMQNNELTYRVVCTAPDDYTANNEKVATISKNGTFTLRHSHPFTATIDWMDDNDASGFRPSPSSSAEVSTALSSLRLYRRDSDGTLTDITGDKSAWQWSSSGDTFSSSDNTWTLTVPNLPTYTDENEEIEYFLVHGTDKKPAGGSETVTTATLATSETGTIYTPHYDNGTGSYASDELRCYDGSKITMLLSSNATFTANVVWKDDNETETINARPTGTVMLWRYARYREDGAEQDATLDEAFEDDRASQVVYVGADGKEYPLCFDLPAGSTGATLTAQNGQITFTYTASDGTTVGTQTIAGTLPGHDSLGRKYTYFVRETLTGNNKDNYSVSYGDTNNEGAPNNGTITNTRREKALVTVDKTWRNPDGVAQIDGASVQLKLYAKATKDANNNGVQPKELEVYKEDEDSYEVLKGRDLEDAQTATGFTSTIPTAQKSYYVNIFDENGLPYDMEHAVLREIVTLAGTSSQITQVDNTITLGTDENASTYLITTNFVEERSDLNPPSGQVKRYHYDQFNTVASKRTYDVIKNWAVNDPVSLPYKENIDAVVVELQRCLVKDLNKPTISWEKVYNYVLVYLDSNNNEWKITLEDLDKYDLDGNAYYYSANELGFLVKNIANTDTMKLPTDANIQTISVDGGQYKGQTKDNYVAFFYYTQLNPSWGRSYSRTEQETAISNNDNPGSGYFSISKSWKDNNDPGRPDSVTIRIYDRTKLYAEVQNKTGYVDWSALENLAIVPVDKNNVSAASADIVLRKPGYAVDQTYKSLCNNNEETAKEKTITDYVVLEYKVGSDKVSYTYEEIAKLAAPPNSTEPDSASASGTAHYTGTDASSNDDDRDYNVTVSRNPSRETYYILNERTGTTTLNLTKTWNDENNHDGLRPNSVSFQLYRDGALCKDLDGVTFTITNNEGNEVVGLTVEAEMNANNYTGTFIANAEANQNTEGTWKIKVDNLPMFSSDSGMLYAYNIDEQNVLAATGDATVHYLQTRGAVQTALTGSHQTFSIELKNTVAGTTTHTAYKYWKDYSVEPKTLRPDLTFALYRYRKSAYANLYNTNQNLPQNPIFDELNSLTSEQKDNIDFEKVTDHDDPVMTANDKSNPITGATGKVYDWQVVINDLQRFDAQGREYAYVLREQMKDSETVRGTYVGETVRTKVASGENQGEYDEFTNTITGNLRLSGVKIWKGHENYSLTMDDLPEPYVTLYRTTDDTLSQLSDLNSKTDNEITSLITEGKLLELDEIQMSGENRSRYSFPSDNIKTQNGTAPENWVLDDDGNLMLPKYDENGKRYTYLMRETLRDENGNLDARVETLYAKTSSSGTLVNTLNPNINRRRITIHKSWRSRLGDDYHLSKYPSVTFELYRYLVDDQNNQQIDQAELYQTKTISAASLAAVTDGQATCEFSDLLVYSPQGKLYGYYVIEKPIKGYDSEFSLTAPSSSSGTESGGGSEQNSGSDQGSGSDTSSQGVLVFSDTAGWDSEDGISNDLYAQNTYTPSEFPLTLTGTKVWNDWHDVAGLRPPSVEVTLKRSTYAESGQSNAIDEHEFEPVVVEQNDTPPTDKPWIMWSKTNQQDGLGRDVWTYEVGGLTRYAPNGMPYRYTITEKNQIEGYKQPGTVGTGNAADTSENDTIALNDLTNSLEKDYLFRKYWHDGSNAYNLRPSSITVILQYSTDNGTTWQDMVYSSEKYELVKDGLRTGDSARWFSYSGGSHVNAIAVELTAADKVGGSGNNNTWQYKFQNLPAKWKVTEANVSTVKDVKYRCLEVKVGAAEVTYPNNEAYPVDGTEYTAGAYKATYQPISDSMTAVENHLDSTTLKVTKIWQGDQQDLYGSRPDSVTFKLQRRGRKSNNDVDSWTDVLLSGGNPYTFQLTKNDTTAENPDHWECTLEDLPVYGTDDVGNTFSLEFRAVELHDSVTNALIKGAKNYEDQTDYDDEDSDGHTFDPEASDAKNTSTITNQLITDSKTIKAEKVWYASNNIADNTVEATFELQYKKKNDSTDVWHSYASELTQKLAKEANGTSQSIEWTNFPTCDRDGNELEYQIIEYPVAGYKTVESNDANTGSGSSATTITTKFTNIELQDYTVTKTWNKPGRDQNNVAYIPAASNGSFTSTFKLQQKIGNGDWTDCTPPKDGEAGTQNLTDNASYTWHDLPKYDSSALGDQITYRAVETYINGNAVNTINGNDTDRNYIVTYDYDGTTTNKNDPAFDDTQTDSANRLVYGFVDLSKEAAYLAPGVTDLNADLSGVEFKIQDSNGNDYATGILTDSNGHLTRNPDGTYGTQHRYLIPGTYTLLEVDTHNVTYARWATGVSFTIGLNGGNTDTGEHGTAWISTDTTTTADGLTLKVTYLAPTAASHSFGDTCAPNNDSADAYNLESRGVIEFTKKGNNEAALDTHSGSYGETPAYFGVYTDSACTNQVAGMTAATDGVSFALTNTAQDGNTLSATNTAQIPYLRAYGTGGFTLLSGTYYVKELVPPAGYIQDTTAREVTIARLETTTMGTDLSQVYANNKGTFTDANTANYQWPNTPNKVTIYKLDQFGRKVRLKDNGYLELTFNNGSFPTGENTIRLYQDTNKPATKNADNGDRVGNGGNDAWSITYDNTDKFWTITGLFDAGKSYTLSEPATAAPDDNITAKPITFTIGADGKMNVASSDTHTTKKETGDITTANGAHDDYNNYYQPDTDNNQVVLRDVARFRKNVALKKIVTGTTTSIQHISFNLYHGEPTDENPGRVTDPPLTTDAGGVIDLSKLNPDVVNQLTGAPLKNGLDLGKYFFREVEMGASDGYRLAGDICFEIKAKASNSDNYEDYAEVVFTSSSTNGNTVTQNEQGQPDRGTVSNTPAQNKTLELTKKDADGTTLLSGARFKLEYESINNGQTGAKQNETTYAMTDANGTLKTATVSGDTWTIGTDAPDISAKGTYTLTELQAPAQHSTYTTSGTTTTPPMLSFVVNSSNEITHVSGTSSYILSAFTGTTFVDEPTVTTGDDGDLTATVKNNKTLVTIDKLSDLRNATKTKTNDQKDLTGETLNGAELEIYQGVDHTGTPVWTNTSGFTNSNTWTLTGVLSENTIYTLHEKTAPVGYLEADDIYFCLFGTRSTGENTVESQLYVWTGTTAPTSATVTPTELSASGSLWSQSQNLKDNDLTMVDEAIIAPVDARKVLDTNGIYTNLPGAEFKVSIGGTNGIELGTVVSGSDGYLKWQSLNDAALNGLVYNNVGKRIQVASDATGQTVILQQNAEGYTFTETYAPDNAYNEGIGLDKVYHVAISDDNYRQYKANPTWVIDLVAAETATNHTVDLAAKRATISELDLINPAYRSTVTLHKYDSDPEGNTANIPGTEFTLYRGSDTTPYAKASVTGGSVQANGIFTTDASGNISITIPEKGTYTLTETKATAGYKLDSTNTFTFTLVDKGENDKFGYNNTTELKREGDTTGVPNARQYGTITLTKTDTNASSVKLDGVVYTLTRTDKPTVITQYFSVAEQTVITGKSYTASYSGEGAERKCTLTEEAGESGIITISGLDWGTYTLAEKTEVSGYQLDMTNQTQQTAHTKTFTIGSGTESRNEVLYPGVESDTNTKNSVTFHKTDNATTPKNLAGAVFEVHDSSDQIVSFYLSANATTPVTQATSGDDGTVTVYGLPTNLNSDTPTTYKLVEVTAPKGYILNPTPVEFAIDRKGNVQVNSSNVTEVPMADKPILVTLKKLGESGTDLLSGAIFTLAPQAGSSFVDGTTSSKTLILQDGELLINVETLIGGHSYTLTETKAPDGYEATAVINFTVGTDGRVTIDSTTGGYRETVNGAETCCTADNELQTGSTGEYKSTLSIRDEEIRVTLTKEDSNDSDTKLGNVTFTLKPYGNNDKFTPGFTDARLSGSGNTATFTDVTDSNGVISIPDGLLVHDCKYLLQETAIGNDANGNAQRYYLGKEAKDGVILSVGTDGSITVEQLTAYNGKTDYNNNSSCPVTANNTSGHVALTAKNPKAATFTFTKDVSGNMGDLTGNFTITMEVFEPDGTKIGEKEVTLKKGEKYSSEFGKLDANGTVIDDTRKFGPNAIPVGATLKIKEDPDGDYEPVVATNIDGATVLTEELKSEAWLRLVRDVGTNGEGNITFTLTNNKQVAIDVGVPLERNAPYAVIAMLIPAAWLYLRAKRRRRDGDK